MKIITKTTLYTSATESVPPGTEVELGVGEALSLVDRGLAELPFVPEIEDEAAAKAQAEADAAAKAPKK